MRSPTKQAAVVSVDDSQDYPVVTANMNGKETDALLFFPYGLCANPPVSAFGPVIAAAGGDAVKYAFADDYSSRFRGLDPGEVQLGNYGQENYTKYADDGSITHKTGSTSVKLNKDGSVEIDTDADVTINAAGSVTITAPAVTINGDVTVNGSISATGNFASAGGAFTHNGTNIGSDHTHGGVATGSGTTGTPS